MGQETVDPARDFHAAAQAVGLEEQLLAEDLTGLMAIPVWPETATGLQIALAPGEISTPSAPLDPKLLITMLNGLNLADLLSLSVASSLDLRQELATMTGADQPSAVSDADVKAYLHSLLAMSLSELMTLGALDGLVITDLADRPGLETPSLSPFRSEAAGALAADPVAPPSDHIAPTPEPTHEAVPVPVPRLFTSGSDTVVFDLIASGSYPAGSQQNAFGGNDHVTLPSNLAQAIEAGYDPLQAFSGGAGNDTIVAGGLADTIDGGAGIDTVSYAGSTGVVVLLQNTDVHGPHANEPAGGTGGLAAGDGYIGIENVIASQFDDYVFGSVTGGAVFLLDGNDEYDNTGTQNVPDYVDGGGGDDAMWGGDGGDTLVGGGGDDRVSGEAGDDMLDGGGGADTLSGGNGNDLLDGGGGGTDQLSGNNGDDILVWRNSELLLAGGSGTDALRLTGGNLVLNNLAVIASGLERVDLASDTGSNVLTLTAADVISLSDTDNLTIAGTSADSVNAGTGWTDGGSDGAGNHVFTRFVGGILATLVVNEAVTVNADITA